MRSGDFSATIVVNGVEQAGQADGVVPVRFGDEYTIRLRAHNGRRAVAQVWIDDVQITQGGIILDRYDPANYHVRYVDLETPPASPGSRFRFAHAESPAAHAAAKGGPDADGTKGLIRVEFQSERMPTPPLHLHTMKRYDKALITPGSRSYDHYEDVWLESCEVGCSSTMDFAPARERSLQEGVTVAGSHSSQSFREEHIDLAGPTVTVLLKLKGLAGGECSSLPPVFQGTSGGVANYCSHCGRRADVLSNRCACGNLLR